MLTSVSAVGSYALGAGNPAGGEELSALRQQWMEQLFNRADSDQDGRLTLTEFSAAYSRFRAQAGGGSGLPQAESLFKDADADSDGAISRQEFVDALQKLYGDTGAASAQGCGTAAGASASQATAEEMLLSLRQGLGLENYLGTGNSSGAGALASVVPGPVLSPAMQVMAENANASTASVEALLAAIGGGGDDGAEKSNQASSGGSLLDFTA